ncbi:MAG: hypothetical protein ACLFTT_03980 [Candidatus Hydrogenedentota bacterium]
MDRKQGIIVGFVFLAIFWGAGITLYLSNNRDTRSASQTAHRAPRFTAKPGTARKNARALVSSERGGGLDSYVAQDDADDAGEQPIEVDSLSKSQEEFSRDLVARAVAAAKAAPTKQAAAMQLRDALDQATQDDHRTRLFLALGRLYLEDPAHSSKAAREQFDAAIAAGGRLDDVLMAAWEKARLLRVAGENETARRFLEDILERTQGARQEERGSAGFLRVRMLQADLDRDAGNMEAAEAGYSAIVDSVTRTAAPAPEPEVLDAYSIAAQRLVHLYRGQGRDADADRISRRAGSRLRAMAAAGS